ncbi:MAG: VWA domain-containing protein [Clostridiales Family XIII bacterium]|jgi:fimbrial isopeptide formation D2 family protein|nr:VWA domain-containing protein [Clostridiales Family XIII bacterium]
MSAGETTEQAISEQETEQDGSESDAENGTEEPDAPNPGADETEEVSDADADAEDETSEAEDPEDDSDLSDVQKPIRSLFADIVSGSLIRAMGAQANIPDDAQLSYPNKSAPGYDALQYPQDPNPGYVRMAKSAEWTDEENGLAEVTFNLWGKPMDTASDIIIVLDVSDSTVWNPGTTNVQDYATIPQYFCPYDGVQLKDTPTPEWKQFSFTMSQRGMRLSASNMDGTPHVHPDVKTVPGPNANYPGTWYMDLPVLPPLNTLLSAEKGATNHFVDIAAANSGNRLALVTFASTATVAAQLGSTTETLHNAIMDAAPGGETNYTDAFLKAKSIIDGRTGADSSRPTTILFVSDGQPNLPSGNISDYESTVSTLKSNGVKIYSVGIGVGAQAVAILNGIQNAGSWNIAAAELPAILEEISNKMISAATNANLADVINAQYFHANGTPQVSQGTATRSGNNVNWNVGEVPSNGYATITIPIKLNDGVTDHVLPTNSGAASLTYKNFNDKNCEILVDTPILLHPSTAIRLEYYLVNDAGEAINTAGTVLNDLSNRIILKPSDYLDQSGNIVSGAQVLEQGHTYTINGFQERFVIDGQWYEWVPASANHGGWNYHNGIVASGSVTKFFGFKKIPTPVLVPPSDCDKNIFNTASSAFEKSYTITDRTEVVRYQISTTLPADVSAYTSMEIQDLMPAKLELSDTAANAVKVYAGNTDVTNKGTITVTPNQDGSSIVSFKFNHASDIATLDKTIRMEILAKIKDTVTDAELADAIKNTGGIIVNNGTPLDTPEAELIVKLAKKVPFRFTKVKASDSSPLPDAAFMLYVCSNEAHTQPGDHDAFDPDTATCWVSVSSGDVASDEQGLVDFGNIESGQYLLLETSAPDGYECPLGWWIISVDADDEHPITSITAEGPLMPPAFIADTGNTNLRLPNYKTTVLPLTGVLPRDLSILTVGAAMIFGLAALVFLSGRRRDPALIKRIVRTVLMTALVVVLTCVAADPDVYADVPTSGSITIHKHAVHDTSESGLRPGTGTAQDVSKLPVEANPMPGVDFTVEKVLIDPTPDTKDDVVFTYGGKSYIADGSGAYAPQTIATDVNGEAVFGGLPLGIYLVSEQGAQSPFLVEIPTVVPGAGGSVLYDIEVYPKTFQPDPDVEPAGEPPGDEPADDVPQQQVHKNTDIPKTGDSFPILSILIAMVIAGIVLILLLLYRRPRPEEKPDHSARAGP